MVHGGVQNGTSGNDQRTEKVSGANSQRRDRY